MQPFKNFQTYFVAILEQNIKKIKEIEQKLAPVDTFQSFSYSNIDVTFEKLHPAFQKFADTIHGYSRAE